MTVIAAMIGPGPWAYIGGDSAATNTDLIQVISNPKVARIKSTMVGYAGSFGAGRQALHALNKIGEETDGSILWRFEQQWKQEHYSDLDMLIVEQGRIYELQGADGSILECYPKDDGTAYAALGEGAAVALGALYVEHIDLRSLLQALQAAETHVPGIRGPMIVLEQPVT